MHAQAWNFDPQIAEAGITIFGGLFGQGSQPVRGEASLGQYNRSVEDSERQDRISATIQRIACQVNDGSRATNEQAVFTRWQRHSAVNFYSGNEWSNASVVVISNRSGWNENVIACQARFAGGGVVNTIRAALYKQVISRICDIVYSRVSARGTYILIKSYSNGGEVR